MNLNEYQDLAEGFANQDLPHREALAVWALGLGGEAGECQELIKKHLGHGHVLNGLALEKELGDVLWYVAVLARQTGLDLESIAATNLAKLQSRYPSGFSSAASLSRRA